MVVGLAQTNIIWENKEQNIRKCDELLAKASNEGVDVVFFPEMSLTGFSMNTEATGEREEYTLDVTKQMAKKHNIYIGIGWVKQQEAGKCENHYTIVSPENKVITDYIKIHPFSYSGEDEFFIGGNELKVGTIKDFNIGSVICYDLRFPEIFQILSAAADLIVVSANWPEQRREHWKSLLKARAIENQAYVAGVNCAGMVGDRFYSGDSMLFAPDGRLVAGRQIFMSHENSNDDYGREQLIIYEIENNVEELRKHFPVKNDRRNELYANMKLEITT